jgi:UDP-N-acetylglucosamine 1-carboxyvinyltransferase
VVGDRIEAGTFIATAALCGEPIDVLGFEPAHLGLVLRKYEQMGITIERLNRGVRVWRDGNIRSVDIQTLPFPGFPTDMQAQTMCLLAVGDSSCVITENVFENRFMFASELQRMGADIRIEGHHAIVHGVPGFSGAEVKSPDLRGGAALVMAGLIADGETTVSDIYHIDRGYERFVEKLQGLGAHVERVEIPDPVL